MKGSECETLNRIKLFPHFFVCKQENLSKWYSAWQNNGVYLHRRTGHRKWRPWQDFGVIHLKPFSNCEFVGMFMLRVAEAV